MIDATHYTTRIVNFLNLVFKIPFYFIYYALLDF
jgi:hypothetical protein